MRDHTESAQIIQLSAFRPKPGKTGRKARPVLDARVAETPISNPQCEEGVSDTAENQRLQKDRRFDWQEADAIMDYWHAAMKIDTADFSRPKHRYARRRSASYPRSEGLLGRWSKNIAKHGHA